jgi:phage portal protein BeeE
MPLFSRHRRSDVSLVVDVLEALAAARSPGVPVNVTELPVVIGITTLHADVLGAMRLEGQTGRGRRTVPERIDPDEPLVYSTAKVVWSAMHTGNAYALRGVGSGRILNPDQVGPLYRDDDPLAVAGWTVAGVEYGPDEVAHLKICDDPRYGPLGRSPFRLAATPLRMYGYAYGYMEDFFSSGGNPSSVISQRHAGGLTYDPAQVAADWITARQERRPAVLPHGLDLSIPPNNGELEAIGRLLEHSAAEVARVTNTPPSLVNARTASSMTYSNVGAELRRWLALSLRPTWLTRLEAFYTDIVEAPVQLDTDALFDLVDATDTLPTPAPVNPIEAAA